jgi:hypothetical protein
MFAVADDLVRRTECGKMSFVAMPPEDQPDEA